MAEIFYDGKGSVDILGDEHRIIAVNRVECRVCGLYVSTEKGDGERITDRSKTRIVEASFSGRFL